jgi:hypothetical protein
MNASTSNKKGTFSIGKRFNPQIKTYYIAYGKLTKAEQKAKSNCAYGSILITTYKNEAEYNAAIEQLKSQGFKVSNY